MPRVLAPQVDVDRFKMIRARVADNYRVLGERIRAKETVHIGPVIFKEQLWLVNEIERIAGKSLSGVMEDAELERYKRVRAYVIRVNKDYADAIGSGEVIKVSAEIFGASRFLVTILERLVDPEDLGKVEIMPDETKSRISLDIAAGIGDSDEEAEAAVLSALAQNDEREGSGMTEGDNEDLDG